ncbi:MAG: hypothetical protein AB7V46_02440, partial [Thermomicrobiales bacterium]
VIALLLIGLHIPTALAEGEATPGASPPPMEVFLEQIMTGQACAWTVEIAPTSNALNAAYPETHASYFVMPYVLSPGESLILEGTYPFARFFSIVTYYRDLGPQGTGLELLGWLPDFAIVPDAGSANPSVDATASTDPSQRSWTIEVTGTASASSEPVVATPVEGRNVLPGMSADIENSIGVMAMRVYLPEDASDTTGGVGLPSLTLVDESNGSRPLTPCTAEERQIWKQFFTPFLEQIIEAAPPLPLPQSVDAPPDWVQNRFPGLGTNPDNRYLMTPVAWTPGRIVVIRGQAPTFPNTLAGDPQTTAADLRYWSFCTGSNVNPLVTTACVADFEIPLDDDGFYTVVVSQPEDQPANATVENGVSWLQGAPPNQPDLLFLRHMLPSDAFFDQSVWAVPEQTSGVAEEIMGPYFPQTVYCDTATFEEGGAEACFSLSATPAAES